VLVEKQQQKKAAESSKYPIFLFSWYFGVVVVGRMRSVGAMENNYNFGGNLFRFII